MDTPKNRLERLIVIPAIAFLAIFIIPQSAVVVRGLVWPLVSALDPEQVFWPVSIRYVFQLVITGLVLKFFFRIDFRQWGFNLNESAVSLRIFGGFALVSLGWLILTSLPNIISGSVPSFNYPLTARNMAGRVGIGLMAGVGEEPLFRGLVMIVIGRYWRGMQRIGNWNIPTSGVVAAFIFMLGHIGYTLSPFAITNFPTYNLFLTFTFSLYYAYVFHRTGSLLGPIISHGYFNLIASVLLYLRAALMS